MNPLNLVPNWLLFLIIGGLSAGVLFQQVRVSNAQASTQRAKADMAIYRGSVAETTRLLQAANDRSHIADLNRKQEAMDAKDVRITRLASDASGALRSLDGLRSAVRIAAHRDSVPGAAIPTDDQPASAQAVVFLECAAAFVGLAKTADGHASDVQTLNDAWPR